MTFHDWLRYLPNSKKIIHTEYIIKCLLNWYSEKSNSDNNNLSKLKIQKMLFFISSNDIKLLQIFDNIRAMPYGHIEVDIYNFMKRGEFIYFKTNNIDTVVRKDINLFELDNMVSEEFKLNVDNSINKLKSINDRMILMSPFDLVDISRRWYSFKKYKNERIPIDEIVKEDKEFLMTIWG